MKKTAKYLAALRTIKADKLAIKAKENSAVYLALCKAGYTWQPETGQWEFSAPDKDFDPKRGFLKIRIIADKKYATDVAEILGGMLITHRFTQVDSPSISPSRKDERDVLVYLTFKLPGCN